MKRHSRHLLPVLLIGGYVLAGCTQSNPSRPDDANNPSPTAGSGSAQKANEMADKAMYKPVEYKNATVRGPNLVVIPGDIKSSNASFTQKFGPNNIADFAELELSQANFGVLERSDLGPLLQEFQLAYTLSDPDAARKLLQRGKLKTTKWVVKLDILKAEPVATAQQGFDGRAVGQLLSIVGRNDRRSDAAGTFVGSIKTEEGTGVWLIGMRYKVLDAVTTEQVATGYAEQKMEVGSKSTSVMGFSQGAQGGLTLDGMVQRLVQQLVFEIDAKHKGAGSPPPAARSVAATVSPGAESTRATPESVVEVESTPIPAATPMATASVPATAATTTPGPATAEPVQPATAEPPPKAPVQGRQSPSDAPSTPPSTAPLELASVAPPPVAAGEAGQGRQAAVPVAASQDRIIKIGTMTAAGRFTTDPVTGTLSGTGIVSWADGNRYEGPMVAGKKQGLGTFVWQNGQRYEGDWLDDQMTGTGILRFADGDRYEGRFKNGEPHGTGVYTLKNGDQYDGEWVGGSKHGKGRLTWASGDYWEGEFRDDRQTDNGKLVVVKPIAVEAKQ